MRDIPFETSDEDIMISKFMGFMFHEIGDINLQYSTNWIWLMDGCG